MSFLSNKNIQTCCSPYDDVAMKLYNLTRSSPSPRRNKQNFNGLSEFLKAGNLGDFRELGNKHQKIFIKSKAKQPKLCYDFLDLNNFLKVRRMTPFKNSRVQKEIGTLRECETLRDNCNRELVINEDLQSFFEIKRASRGRTSRKCLRTTIPLRDIIDTNQSSPVQLKAVQELVQIATPEQQSNLRCLKVNTVNFENLSNIVSPKVKIQEQNSNFDSSRKYLRTIPTVKIK